MTTHNELPCVEDPNKILHHSVIEKLNEIHQTNNSEDSSFFHPLSIPCIYKVSKELRKLNKSAYNPYVVSIGPIHYSNDDDDDDDDDDEDDKEEQHLKEMENIKWAYTKELLCRIAGKSATPENKGYWMDKAVMECSTAMLHLEASALNCYDENLKPIIEKKIPKHGLAQMLLIDGCFILELLYRSYSENNKIIPGDPLLGNSMFRLGIQHDLLLLENQLPYFILNELFNKTIKTIPDHPWAPCPSLTEFVLSFFANMMIFDNDDIQPPTINPEKDDCYHILHLLHSCYPPSSNDPLELKNFSHRASDLNRAGVKFVPGKGKNQFDVNFEEASLLLWWCDSAKFEIPPLSIDDFTEPFLRNLIAFEQCCPYIERHFTSYAFLMDSLINSAADVELLEKAQIIHNYLGASEDASVLFNNICKYAELEKFDFAIPRDDAEKHCRSFWPNILALLKRKYFSNPWSGFAVVAACILFVIAVVQTVYALLTYYGVEYETVRELNDMHSVL